MRIVAAPADFAGCGTYRILLPYRALARRGHDVAFVTKPEDRRILSAEIFVIQRQLRPYVLDLVRLLRQRSLPVVYELDDNLHCVPSSNPTSKWYGSGRPATKMVERFLREVDAVTVSTPALAAEYQRFNKNIYVCENVLDDAHVARIAPAEITGRLKRPGQIRIGWAGSNTHLGDLTTIVPVLSRLLARDDRIRFITIGDRFSHLFSAELRPRVEFVPGTTTAAFIDLDYLDDSFLGLVRYYDLARSTDLDIALAPLEHTTFNRCKSDLKLKEYGALGLPAVATRFGPYFRYHSQAPERVVLLAGDDREWELAIHRLIESAELRASLASANLAYVQRCHVMSAALRAWEGALEAVLADAVSARRRRFVDALSLDLQHVGA